MIRSALIVFFSATVAGADALVTVRTIPAQSVVGPNDIVLSDVSAPGAISDPALVVGQEARIALFAGRPIRLSDIRTPAVVERNEIVQLIYAGGGLVIKTDGRALDRAGPGERIRVMNLASRTTVTATIDDLGVAYVAQ